MQWKDVLSIKDRETVKANLVIFCWFLKNVQILARGKVTRLVTVTYSISLWQLHWRLTQTTDTNLRCHHGRTTKM